MTSSTGVTDTGSINTLSSTHTSSRADLLTDSGTVRDRVRAVNSSVISLDSDGSLLGTLDLVSTDTDGDSSVGTTSTAGSLEAEGGGGGRLGGGQSTSETLATSSSSESLESR